MCVAQRDETDGALYSTKDRCRTASQDMMRKITKRKPRTSHRNGPASLTLADPCAPARPMLEGKLGLYVSLDHVGKHSSLNVRELEVREVGSRRKDVLIIGSIAL